MANVIWRPQPKQAIFLSRPEYEACYGGAAGGGKSDALLAEALRQVHIPHYRAIIFRKTYPQLSELIDRSREIYSAAFPRAKYNSSGHFWAFPSGAKIYFGNMQRTQDRVNYQGKRYDFIGFDELTHFTWDEYSYMFSRNRPNGPGTRVYIRATTNPGGVGHGWVKERFISAAPPMTTITENIEIKQPDGRIERKTRDRVFVPASVFDNKILLDNNPTYTASLAMLPEAEQRALLYGDWDSFSGQVFTEFVDDSQHYDDRLYTHVIAPFRIPAHWRIYRGFDFGYTRPFSVGWYAVDEERRIYRIAEYYGCTNTPNTGVKMEPAEIAAAIREKEEEHPLLQGKKIIGVADPAIFEESHGESIAAMMAKAGVFFGRGDHKRLPGKMQYHYRFAFDDRGIPMFYVFNTCRHFMRTIPNLVYDEKHVEDINTDGEDHCLVGSTLVWTNTGLKPISEIDQNGYVYSSDGKLHRYYDCRLTQRDVQVYTVEMEDGTKITATKNHRFMLENGEWKRLDQLEENDELFMCEKPLDFIVATDAQCAEKNLRQNIDMEKIKTTFVRRLVKRDI